MVWKPNTARETFLLHPCRGQRRRETGQHTGSTPGRWERR